MRLSLIYEEKQGFDATIAVDLDGTLAQELEHFDPDKIGPPIHNAKKVMVKVQALEVCIVINTCRGDVELVREWLQEHDIPFNYINENPNQPDDSSDKIMADRYWDNKQPSWRGLQYAYEELRRYLRRINEARRLARRPTSHCKHCGNSTQIECDQCHEPVCKSHRAFYDTEIYGEEKWCFDCCAKAGLKVGEGLKRMKTNDRLYPAIVAYDPDIEYHRYGLLPRNTHKTSTRHGD